MELFTNLFGSLLAFVYHCFDRIVILGYVPLLIRPENIAHFFQNVHKVSPITKEVLRKRTDEYHVATLFRRSRGWLFVVRAGALKPSLHGSSVCGASIALQLQ